MLGMRILRGGPWGRPFSSLLFCFLWAGLGEMEGLACSVPVFRYALEQWIPDPYEVFVFHSDPLSSEHRILLDSLQGNDEIPPPANLVVTEVDLNQDMPEEIQTLWRAHRSKNLPWLVVALPWLSGDFQFVWSGSLSQESLDRVQHSPKREEILRRLLSGESAVWVLVQSGKPETDERALTLLKTELARQEGSLSLPELAEEDSRYLSPEGPPLKVAFSVLILSREDPREQLLVNALLQSEEDLAETQEPLAFPVYGRGRILYALVGSGINPENIEDACIFLTGACSCMVKSMNPGMDLLLAADWDQSLGIALEGASGDEARRLRAQGIALSRMPKPERTAVSYRGLVLAAVLVLVAGSTGGLWWWMRQRYR